jgi:hypothetical protein
LLATIEFSQIAEGLSLSMSEQGSKGEREKHVIWDQDEVFYTSERRNDWCEEELIELYGTLYVKGSTLR